VIKHSTLCCYEQNKGRGNRNLQAGIDHDFEHVKSFFVFQLRTQLCGTAMRAHEQVGGLQPGAPSFLGKKPDVTLPNFSILRASGGEE